MSQEIIHQYIENFSYEKKLWFSKLPIQEKWEFIKSKNICTKQEFINYINSLLIEIPDEELMERKEKYYGTRNY
jgi:hypothetical protein